MSKARRKIDTGPKQRSLFDVLLEAKKAEGQGLEEGALECSARLRAALNAAFRDCPLSRHQVAGEMSHLLGRTVTKAQLDAWTAESKEGHRFPAEYLPAFCRAVRSHRPLEILAEAAGCFALPGPDALRAEIKKLDEEQKRISARKRQREMFLKEMEGGK